MKYKVTVIRYFETDLFPSHVHYREQKSNIYLLFFLCDKKPSDSFVWDILRFTLILVTFLPPREQQKKMSNFFMMGLVFRAL